MKLIIVPLYHMSYYHGTTRIDDDDDVVAVVVDDADDDADASMSIRYTMTTQSVAHH